MVRILIWGLGFNYNIYINAIKYYEMMGDIEVVGVTDKRELYTCLDGYPFIPLDHIHSYEIDYIAITSSNYFTEIRLQAMECGFLEKQLISAKIFCLPGFQFKRYQELLESKVSIIANNCWGGLVYHALGMKMYSPFVNMFLHDSDYFKLLNNLQNYLGCQLQFKKYGYNPALKIEYPVCGLDDIELHFNHATSMNEVEEKWYERVGRLNWDNLFIMMMYMGEGKDTVEKFEQLDYKKKIYFAPFDSTHQSVVSLRNLYEKVCGDEKLFYQCVNEIPRGAYHDYDLIELLLTGQPNHNRYYMK